MDFNDLVEKIKIGLRFDFSRWGDGEFNAIFRDQKSTQNCDGHRYFDDMGDRLLNVLKSSPQYYIGLQNLAHMQRPKQIDELTEVYNLKWIEANIIHRASIKGQLPELTKSLREREVLLIGPEHLQEYAEVRGWQHIEIPSKDCWEDYEHIKNKIAELINKDLVILYCASMMANVLIDDFAGRATQIDVGSVFDPYTGVKSRSYHSNLKI